MIRRTSARIRRLHHRQAGAAIAGTAVRRAGLGDSSYPQFCAIGRRLDERLAELGAKRWFARGEADLDIDSVAMPWLANALASAKEALKPQAPLATVTSLAAAVSTYTRDNPFPGELLVN